MNSCNLFRYVMTCLGLAFTVFPVSVTENTMNLTSYLTSSDGEASFQCCVPDEWEALAFLDVGNVIYDRNTYFSYLNGTVHFAYSFTKAKVYLNVTALEQSPLLPKPGLHHTVMLYDFHAGTIYELEDGDCTKSPLEKKMDRQCVPEGATLMSKGKMAASNTTLTTYGFTSESGHRMVVTVHEHAEESTPLECDVIQVDYLPPPNDPVGGILVRMEMVDIAAVKDESVFDIPKPCR